MRVHRLGYQQGQPLTEENLTQMSTDAVRIMNELLNEFGVGHSDDSDLHGRIARWEEPWERFPNH